MIGVGKSEVRVMDKVKEYNRLDKMIARTKELQKEIDHRHEVEEKVFKLFSEGKFEEGDALLDTLDDKKVMELAEGVVATEKKSADCESKKAINLYLKVNCADVELKNNLEKLNDVICKIVDLQEKGTKLNVRILANMK
jgi:gamma-glutamyl:cysteine ligase YbdK (ATP-grasp superfamily)